MHSFRMAKEIVIEKAMIIAIEAEFEKECRKIYDCRKKNKCN